MSTLIGRVSLYIEIKSKKMKIALIKSHKIWYIEIECFENEKLLFLSEMHVGLPNRISKDLEINYVDLCSRKRMEIQS